MKNPILLKPLLLVALACAPGLASAQSNILYNGSFEAGRALDGWNGGNFGAYVHEAYPADGYNYCQLFTSGTVWQDVPTIPGRNYRVNYAFSGSGVQLWWNNAFVGQGTDGSYYSSWTYTNFVVAATGSVSHLEFRGNGLLDNITMGWNEEPPSIVVPVASRSTFEAGNVSFAVGAIGGPPLHYQWAFQGKPLPGATNSILLLTNVQKAMAGDYQVTVSNAYGQVSSLPASLVAQPLPKAPLIVYQPKNIQMTRGYGAHFFVFAVSTEPLSYQWRRNGNDLPGATNASFAIAAVDFSDVGQYSVLVSNHWGSALSWPAALSVQSGTGGGFVDWGNITAFTDAPVFDVDGVTRLEGPAYVAQLYAGATSNVLHAVGSPTAFEAGELAGYYFPYNAEAIPDVLAGQLAYVQVRVWNTNNGASFEEAATLGGNCGMSRVFTVRVFAIPAPPEYVFDLWSFKLQAGQPLLATAKFYPGDRLPNGQTQWLLVGDAGAQYVLERRIPPNDWVPFQVVTNLTGTVSFVDPDAQNNSAQFYRARIVEP